MAGTHTLRRFIWQVTIELDDDAWAPSLDGAYTALAAGLAATDSTSSSGWNGIVRPALSATNFTRVNDSIVSVILVGADRYATRWGSYTQAVQPAHVVCLLYAYALHLAPCIARCWTLLCTLLAAVYTSCCSTQLHLAGSTCVTASQSCSRLLCPPSRCSRASSSRRCRSW